MARFYIIADDLTGANDAGVQLSKIGVPSSVLFDFNAASETSIEQVPIIDTDSRALSEEKAYKTVYQAGTLFKKEGFKHVYKKIDSTLRGNVAAEMAAIVSVHQPEIIVMASAYPKMNRHTINGFQHVDGHPVSETEFGKDPKTPVKESFIPALLKPYVKDKIVIVDHDLLNASPQELMRNISEQAKCERVWFVCDAKTDGDLKRVADVFAQLNKKTVWAGSAGLIEYLPDALQLKKTTIHSLKEMEISKTLTVSASLSNVTKAQLEKVNNVADSFFVEVNPVDLMKKTYCMQEIIAMIEKNTFKQHFVLFVDSSIENREATKETGSSLFLSDAQVSETISKELGKIAKAILERLPEINGLILTGGDTAKAVCMQLNMNQMQLYSEIEAGLPLGKLSNDTQRFWTVTKAGGFGNDHSLVNALEYMTGRIEQYEPQ